MRGCHWWCGERSVGMTANLGEMGEDRNLCIESFCR